MAQIITNPTPKQRFIDNPQAVTGHRALIEHASFQRSVDMALLEYQRALAVVPVDFQGAAMNQFKLVGALEFLQTLRLLAETPVRPVVMNKDNLNPTT
jgi:hypothetical protein